MANNAEFLENTKFVEVETHNYMYPPIAFFIFEGSNVAFDIPEVVVMRDKCKRLTINNDAFEVALKQLTIANEKHKRMKDIDYIPDQF